MTLAVAGINGGSTSGLQYQVTITQVVTGRRRLAGDGPVSYTITQASNVFTFAEGGSADGERRAALGWAGPRWAGLPCGPALSSAGRSGRSRPPVPAWSAPSHPAAHSAGPCSARRPPPRARPPLALLPAGEATIGPLCGAT